jgi:hypothetical protein
MFVVHGTSPKQKKIGKIMQCPIIKSPLLLYVEGVFFFLQEKYFVFIV